MALFFERTQPCAQNVLDTADIVRDAASRTRLWLASGWGCQGRRKLPIVASWRYSRRAGREAISCGSDATVSIKSASATTIPRKAKSYCANRNPYTASSSGSTAVDPTGLGTGSVTETQVPASEESIFISPLKCRSRSRIPLIPTPEPRD